MKNGHWKGHPSQGPKSGKGLRLYQWVFKIKTSVLDFEVLNMGIIYWPRILQEYRLHHDTQNQSQNKDTSVLYLNAVQIQKGYIRGKWQFSCLTEGMFPSLEKTSSTGQRPTKCSASPWLQCRGPEQLGRAPAGLRQHAHSHPSSAETFPAKRREVFIVGVFLHQTEAKNKNKKQKSSRLTY